MEPSLLPHTRVHAFPLVERTGLHCYLKRDDEAGGLSTAGKLRKYASLVPQLQSRGVTTVALLGSANSNNLVGLSQLLLQRGIQPVPFVLDGNAVGSNQLFLRMLVPTAAWQRFARSARAQVEASAQAWVTTQASEGVVADWIPEGCWMAEALPGAMQLASDILVNEEELGVRFQHIFIDAGTGLSAMGLLLGWPERRPRPHVHVVLLADSPADFLKRWQQACEWAGSTSDWELGRDFSLHVPRFGRAFGSVQTAVLTNMVTLARRLGVLCDPIYNGKLMLEAAEILAESQNVHGNVLILHSGGSHILPGYADKLEGLL
jgi:1-aminocyclopropane-1-carboxylate deaminase